MAAALRARLELLGGKEIIATFDRIKQGAKDGFGTIEKEAKKATKDVKELERELAKLEAEAKAIKANIKVTKGQSLTGEQQQALALAKQLEQQAAGVRQQIDSANDSLRLGGGDALRTLAGSADKDLLKVASATDQIDASLADIRSSGGFGGLISDDQIARLEDISKSLRLKNTDYFDGLGRRVETADSIDVVKKQESDAKEEARQARLAQAAERRRRREKAASEKAAADAAAEAKAREEALRKSNDNVRRAMETYRRRQARDSQYLQQLAEQSSQAELRRIKAVARYREHQVFQTAELERKAGERIVAQSRIDLTRRVAAEREAARLIGRTRIGDRIRDLSAHPGRALAAGAQSIPNFGVAIRDSKAYQAALAALGLGLIKLGQGFKNAFDGGKVFTGVLGQIGRTASSTIRDISAFGKALEGVAGALGKVALRSTVATAIVGLVGAIGIALATLGGAAVVAGIGAISALAALNVQGLKNAAAEIGTSVESLTRLSYVGKIAGIEQDDMTKGLKALQDLSVSVVEGAESAQDATRLLKMAGIDVYKKGSSDLKDQVDLVRELARAYQKLRTPSLKKAWLEQLGGDSFKDITALIPLLETPLDKLEERLRKADQSGFTIVEGQLEALTHLAELFREIWANIIGTANKLTGQLMPSLEPMLQSFNAWLLANQQEIIDFLIWLFQSVVTISTDFFNLYKSGGAAEVINQWTKTLYDNVTKVVDVFKQMWATFKIGWDFAAPYLEQLGEKLGTGGAISTAIVLLSAWVLGFFGLFKAGGKLAVAGLQLVSSFIADTLVPVIRGALLWVAGIFGWPVLLASGLGLVYAFWDEIGTIIEGAWKKFKETFPETAKVLEDAFGPALAAIKQFWTDFNGEFTKNYPDLAGTLGGIKDSLDAIIETLKNFDWGMLLNGLSNGVLLTLNGLLGTLNAIAAVIGQIMAFAGLIDNPADSTAAERDMAKNDPAQYQAYADMVHRGGGETKIDRFRMDTGIDLSGGSSLSDSAPAAQPAPEPLPPKWPMPRSMTQGAPASPSTTVAPAAAVQTVGAPSVQPPVAASASTAGQKAMTQNADALMAALANLVAGRGMPIPVPAAPAYAVPDSGSSQIAGASSLAFAGGPAPFSEDMLKSLFAGTTPFVINVDTGDTVYAIAPQGADLQGVAAALGANSRAQIAPRRF